MTTETISKDSGYVADMFPSLNQYQSRSPTKMLSMMVNNSVGGEDFQFSKPMAEKIAMRLPKEMASLKYDSKGAVTFSKQAITADFLASGSGGSSVSGSGIVPILVLDAIVEGAMAYTCCRDIVPVSQLKVESETMPFFTQVGTVPPSAYGAEAYDLAQEIGKALSKTKSYKLTCGIAKELLADSQGDLLGSALNEMGKTMEVTLDTVVIEGLTAAADSTVTEVSASTSNELKGLIAANGAVGANKYRPDAAIMTPMFCAGTMAQFIPAYNPIAQGWVAGSNILGQWAGMKLGRSGITTATAANWKWGTTNDYGAIVVDSSKCGKIGMREDMTFDEFENVTKWVKNPVLVSRFCYIPPVDEDKAARNNKKAIRRLKQVA